MKKIIIVVITVLGLVGLFGVNNTMSKDIKVEDYSQSITVDTVNKYLAVVHKYDNEVLHVDSFDITENGEVHCYQYDENGKCAYESWIDMTYLYNVARKG
jgi:hypothetical protein